MNRKTLRSALVIGALIASSCGSSDGGEASASTTDEGTVSTVVESTRYGEDRSLWLAFAKKCELLPNRNSDYNEKDAHAANDLSNVFLHSASDRTQCSASFYIGA